MKNFIRHHPILFYYLFVFTISWGGILILIDGPDHIPDTNERAERLFVPALLIMFAGPFLSGILMNFLIDGMKGLRNLFSRFLNWRIKGRWYLIAIFTGPIIVAALLFGLSLFNKEFLPGIITAKDKIGLIIFGVSWGLFGGGLLEETGWTGFAIPQLRKHYNILSTGLIVGILWGVWHLLIAFWASDYFSGTNSYTMFVAGFIAFYFLALPAFRVLLVMVYDRTKNLIIIMLMHAFLSASTLIFQPSSTGVIGFIWNLVLGIILCIIVVSIYTSPLQYLMQKPNKKESLS